MNMDLIIIVIICYILKNNSCRYCYAENRNQKLLLFLLFINEMNECLNNNYSYINSINKNGYYMNYPKHPLNNSNNNINNSKDTYTNKNEDNMINSEKDITTNNNNNKDDIIKSYKDDPIGKDNDSFINANKNNIIYDNEDKTINNNNITSINNDEYYIINSDKTPSTNNIKDNIINRDEVINDIFNLINSDEDITIKDNKDNSISDNKNCNTHDEKYDNEDTIINNDEYDIMNNDKNPSTNNIKDNIIDRNKVINDIFNLTNSDEDTTIKDNKDNCISNNKNCNPHDEKYELIKPAAKIHNESSTYRPPCQNTNSISNTFKQFPLAQTITNISEFTKHFDLKVPTPLTDVKIKAPVLVGSTNITELFHGKVTFCNPIISILKVSNEIFITSKSILPNLHTNANNAVLHYEGFLKTHLEYLEDIIIEKYQIKCDSKHYIMLIPFSGSKDLNLTDEIINSPDTILKDLTLDINKTTFFVDTCLEEPTKGNKYVNLYKTCNLTVKAECDISLYRKKLVDLQ